MEDTETHALLSLLGLTNGAPLLAGTRVLEMIGTSFRAEAAVLWKADDEKIALECVQCWSNGFHSAEQLLDGLKTLELWPLEGLPGKVWAEGRAHTLNELAEDKHSYRSTLLAKAGIRSVFGIPVKNGFETVYVLELFAREPGSFCATSQLRIEALSQLLGQVRFGICHLVSSKRAETRNGRVHDGRLSLS